MINDIISGHLKNLFNQEEELYKERNKVCKSCPLYKIDNILGEICNSKLYVNLETGQTSNYPKMGYLNGCSCKIDQKARLVYEKCPLEKW